jgi:hypothetical protein
MVECSYKIIFIKKNDPYFTNIKLDLEEWLDHLEKYKIVYAFEKYRLICQTHTVLRS